MISWVPRGKAGREGVGWGYWQVGLGLGLGTGAGGGVVIQALKPPTLSYSVPLHFPAARGRGNNWEVVSDAEDSPREWLQTLLWGVALMGWAQRQSKEAEGTRARAWNPRTNEPPPISYGCPSVIVLRRAPPGLPGITSYGCENSSKGNPGNNITLYIHQSDLSQPIPVGKSQLF